MQSENPTDRAKIVMDDIYNIMSTRTAVDQESDRRGMKLAALLYEAKVNQYWKVAEYTDEDAWVQDTFPQSKAQYFALIGIARDLADIPQDKLEELGRVKCSALARLKKHLGTLSPEWIAMAESMRANNFKRAVKDFMDKRKRPNPDDAPQEMIFVKFQLVGDQIPVVLEALKIAGLESGSNKSKGLNLTNICADYLSGHTEDGAGRLKDRNGFILTMVESLAGQMSKDDGTWAERLVGLISAVLHRAQEESIGEESLPAEEGENPDAEPV